MTTFEAMAASGGQLRRALRVRHLVMLSVGGTIASGFLLFAGSAIGIAGPAVIISYVIAGIITVAVMACLAELCVVKPVSASFATYARDTMGPRPFTGAVSEENPLHTTVNHRSAPDPLIAHGGSFPGPCSNSCSGGRSVRGRRDAA